MSDLLPDPLTGEPLDPATLLMFEADYRAEIQQARLLPDGRLWLEFRDHEVVTPGPAEVCAGIVKTLLSFPAPEAAERMAA